ncbi:hypothetical protein E8E15_004764 [Penicillium rubens]|nr:hypothetical protein E8E15_004764 [Penicillium rubens]
MANEDTTQQGMAIDNFNARQGQSVEVHRIRDIERVSEASTTLSTLDAFNQA